MMMMWTQKGGTKIAIADMGDSHLLNAHRVMCEKLEITTSLVDRAGVAYSELDGNLGKQVLGMIDDEFSLRSEILERKINPLVALVEHGYLTMLIADAVLKADELERDIVRAAYEAYCSDRAMPTGDMEVSDG